ncbi:MAG: ABC transporter permease [Bacteroidota bacterium]
MRPPTLATDEEAGLRVTEVDRESRGMAPMGDDRTGHEDGGDRQARSFLRTIRHSEQLPLTAFLLVLCLVMLATSSVFGSTQNVTNLGRQASVLAVLAIAQTFVILIGGIDISIGGTMAVTSVIAAQLTNEWGTVVPAFAVALATALGVGMINGLLIAVMRLSPVVVTIAMWQALTGLSLVLSDGRPILPTEDGYYTLGSHDLGPIPLITVIAVSTLIAGGSLLRQTRFGRYVYATGGNETAAHLAGIATTRITFWCYTLCGLLSGLAGLLLSSRLGTANASLGSAMVFSVFAAVFIGGVGWGGGKGTVTGVTLGVVLLTVISNALDLHLVSSAWQQMITAAMIVVAVGVYRLRRQS